MSMSSTSTMMGTEAQVLVMENRPTYGARGAYHSTGASLAKDILVMSGKVQ